MVCFRTHLSTRPVQEHISFALEYIIMAGMNNFLHLMRQLPKDQREYGDKFQYYREGLDWDRDARKQAFGNRDLPQPVIIDAYDPVLAIRLSNRRRAALNAGRFNRISNPRPNIRSQVARRNPADIARALGDFQQLQANWGNSLKCQ